MNIFYHFTQYNKTPLNVAQTYDYRDVVRYLTDDGMCLIVYINN